MALGEMGRSGDTKINGRAWHHQSNVPRLGVVCKALCLPGQLGPKLGNNVQRDDHPKPFVLSRRGMERHERGKQVAFSKRV